MANTSISGLAAGAAVTATDLLPNVQTVGVGPVKTTADQLKTFMSASPALVTPTLGVAAGTSLALTPGAGATALTLTGGTQTTSFPVIDAVQTWNGAAVVFTGIKLNVTDTTSSSLSTLIDLQVAGASKFNVNRTGLGTFANGVDASTGNIVRAGGVLFGAASDVIIRRGIAGSGNLQMGSGDAAAPVAQILSVQSVITGTADTAGVNFTIKGSAGTGSAAGGSIIFQVAPLGGAGSAQNAFADALTIDSTRTATFATTVVATTLQPGSSVNQKITGAITNTLSLWAAGSEQLRLTSLGWTVVSWNSGNPLTIGTLNQAGASDRAGTPIIVNVAGGSGAGNPGYFSVQTAPVLTSGTTGQISETAFKVWTQSTGVYMAGWGGSTSSFPALKRSATTLQARLADDSAFAPIQGKLTTDTAYTAGAAGAATGYITIYDNTGTAYKVEARL